MRTTRTAPTLLFWVCLLLLPGCPGKAPSLEGTWLEDSKEWGLRFEGGRVTEIEGGRDEKTAPYEFQVDVTPNRLIIRDPNEDAPLYSLIEVTGDRLRMTPPAAQVPKDFASAGPVVELSRQE